MEKADLATLKTELTTDPIGRGYAAMSHKQSADTFEIRDRTCANDTTTGGNVASAIARVDWAALSAADRSYCQMLASASVLQLKGAAVAVKDELKVMFPAGTPTRANLVALFRRVGDRAEELEIPHPTPSDIADALR